MADELVEQQTKEEATNLPAGQNPDLSGQGKLVLILVIFGVALVLYLITASSQGLFPFSEEKITTLTPTPTATLTPSETNSWKTYRNEDYGFEIKYPSNLEKGTDVSQYGVDTILFSNKNSGTDIEYKFQVSIDNNINSGADPLTVLNQQPQNVVSGPTALTVGNNSTKGYRIKWNYQGKEYIYNLAYFSYQNKIYAFNDLGLKENEFYQILSTFKFIEPDQSGQPCIQVITPARNLQTGEVKDFPTPCDVPEGWEKIIEASSVKLYFPNESIKPIGQLSCDEALVAVTHLIPKISNIATQTLEELLKGPTTTEKLNGYTSEIPEGSKLNSLKIENGVAFADFNQITESGGGSCSMAARSAQIRKTLLQFSTIKSVKI